MDELHVRLQLSSSTAAAATVVISTSFPSSISSTSSTNRSLHCQTTRQCSVLSTTTTTTSTTDSTTPAVPPRQSHPLSTNTTTTTTTTTPWSNVANPNCNMMSTSFKMTLLSYDMFSMMVPLGGWYGRTPEVTTDPHLIDDDEEELEELISVLPAAPAAAVGVGMTTNITRAAVGVPNTTPDDDGTNAMTPAVATTTQTGPDATIISSHFMFDEQLLQALDRYQTIQSGNAALPEPPAHSSNLGMIAIPSVQGHSVSASCHRRMPPCTDQTVTNHRSVAHPMVHLDLMTTWMTAPGITTMVTTNPTPATAPPPAPPKIHAAANDDVHPHPPLVAAAVVTMDGRATHHHVERVAVENDAAMNLHRLYHIHESGWSPAVLPIQLPPSTGPPEAPPRHSGPIFPASVIPNPTVMSYDVISLVAEPATTTGSRCRNHGAEGTALWLPVMGSPHHTPPDGPCHEPGGDTVVLEPVAGNNNNNKNDDDMDHVATTQRMMIGTIFANHDEVVEAPRNEQCPWNYGSITTVDESWSPTNHFGGHIVLPHQIGPIVMDQPATTTGPVFPASVSEPVALAPNGENVPVSWMEYDVLSLATLVSPKPKIPSFADDAAAPVVVHEQNMAMSTTPVNEMTTVAQVIPVKVEAKTTTVQEVVHLDNATRMVRDQNDATGETGSDTNRLLAPTTANATNVTKDIVQLESIMEPSQRLIDNTDLVSQLLGSLNQFQTIQNGALYDSSCQPSTNHSPDFMIPIRSSTIAKRHIVDFNASPTFATSTTTHSGNSQMIPLDMISTAITSPFIVLQPTLNLSSSASESHSGDEVSRPVEIPVSAAAHELLDNSPLIDAVADSTAAATSELHTNRTMILAETEATVHDVSIERAAQNVPVSSLQDEPTLETVEQISTCFEDISDRVMTGPEQDMSSEEIPVSAVVLHAVDATPLENETEETVQETENVVMIERDSENVPECALMDEPAPDTVEQDTTMLGDCNDKVVTCPEHEVTGEEIPALPAAFENGTEGTVDEIEEMMERGTDNVPESTLMDELAPETVEQDTTILEDCNDKVVTCPEQEVTGEEIPALPAALHTVDATPLGNETEGAVRETENEVIIERDSENVPESALMDEPAPDTVEQVTTILEGCNGKFGTGPELQVTSEEMPTSPTAPRMEDAAPLRNETGDDLMMEPDAENVPEIAVMDERAQETVEQETTILEILDTAVDLIAVVPSENDTNRNMITDEEEGMFHETENNLMMEREPQNLTVGALKHELAPDILKQTTTCFEDSNDMMATSHEQDEANVKTPVNAEENVEKQAICNSHAETDDHDFVEIEAANEANVQLEANVENDIQPNTVTQPLTSDKNDTPPGCDIVLTIPSEDFSMATIVENDIPVIEDADVLFLGNVAEYEDVHEQLDMGNDNAPVTTSEHQLPVPVTPEYEEICEHETAAYERKMNRDFDVLTLQNTSMSASTSTEGNENITTGTISTKEHEETSVEEKPLPEIIPSVITTVTDRIKIAEKPHTVSYAEMAKKSQAVSSVTSTASHEQSVLITNASIINAVKDTHKTATSQSNQTASGISRFVPSLGGVVAAAPLKKQKSDGVAEPRHAKNRREVIVPTIDPYVLVLMSSVVKVNGGENVLTRQTKVLSFMESNAIKYRTLDATNTLHQNECTGLHLISRLSNVYPQFFHVDTSGIPVYCGTIDQIENLIEDGSFVRKFGGHGLTINSVTTSIEKHACDVVPTATKGLGSRNESNAIVETLGVDNSDNVEITSAAGFSVSDEGATNESNSNESTNRAAKKKNGKDKSKTRAATDAMSSDANQKEEVKSEITVYGATSFVAKHAFDYFMQVSLSIPGDRTITLAGRNESKLTALQSTLTEKMANLTMTTKKPMGRCRFDVFVADSADTAGLAEMAKRTQLVANFAGPYVKYGEHVLAACAKSGTDYIDITGEVSWAGEMRQRYSDIAQNSGSRIISLCGFDSIPSDLAIFGAVDALRRARRSNVEVEAGTCWHSSAGMANGGTIHTVLEMPVKLRYCLSQPVPFLLDDPLVLTHPRTRFDPDLQEMKNRMAKVEWWNQLPSFDSILIMGASAPFFMAPVNAKVVHATALALNYGPYFTYRERFLPLGVAPTRKMGFLSILPALMVQLGLYFVAAILMTPYIGKFLADWLAPPGSGSPDNWCQAGFAHVYAEVSTKPDNRLVVDKATCSINFEGDPGNWVTAQCVCESALALVLDKGKLPPRSKDGFGTPAELLGTVLLNRLQTTSVRPVKVKTHVRKDVPQHETIVNL